VPNIGHKSGIIKSVQSIFSKLTDKLVHLRIVMQWFSRASQKPEIRMT